MADDLGYGELGCYGQKQAALYQGRWKGIRMGGTNAPVQLYDQQNDVAEKTNAAADHPEIAEKISAYLAAARTDLPEWKPKWETGRTAERPRPQP